MTPQAVKEALEGLKAELKEIEEQLDGWITPEGAIDPVADDTQRAWAAASIVSRDRLRAAIAALESLQAAQGEVVAWLRDDGNVLDASYKAQNPNEEGISEFNIPLVRAALLSSKPEGARLWDAESIKDAPEGFYYMARNGRDWSERAWPKDSLIELWPDGNTGRAYGPIPQPPAAGGEG